MKQARLIHVARSALAAVLASAAFAEPRAGAEGELIEAVPVVRNGCGRVQMNCDDSDPCTIDSCEAGDCTNILQDTDTDGVCDEEESCPGFDDNADRDQDGVPDGCDNCEAVANADQEDRDGDGVGDVCTPPPVEAPSPGACCYPDATCDTAQGSEGCVALGGTFQGIGSDCADVSCPCEQPDAVSLLFSVLSFSPVCGEGCLMAVSLTLFGLWRGRNSSRSGSRRRAL